MNAWHRFSLGLLAVIALSGCADNDDAMPDQEHQPEQQSNLTSEPANEPEDVEPLSVEIHASATLQSDRRLMVQGETNLPHESRLLVVTERELSGVRWQTRVTVAEGRFTAGPFGPGSGLPDGGYTITINLLESSVQPQTVRDRIGERGEFLEGELVRQSQHGLGQVVSYSRRYLIGSEPRRATDQVDVLEVE